MALRALDAAGDVIRAKDRQREFGAVFFAVSVGASTQALRHQKAICRDIQRSMMMKTSPATSFIVA